MPELDQRMILAVGELGHAVQPFCTAGLTQIHQVLIRPGKDPIIVIEKMQIFAFGNCSSGITGNTSFTLIRVDNMEPFRCLPVCWDE